MRRRIRTSTRTFPHLDATTNLSRAIAELGIYPGLALLKAVTRLQVSSHQTRMRV